MVIGLGLFGTVVIILLIPYFPKKPLILTSLSPVCHFTPDCKWLMHIGFPCHMMCYMQGIARSLKTVGDVVGTSDEQTRENHVATARAGAVNGVDLF